MTAFRVHYTTSNGKFSTTVQAADPEKAAAAVRKTVVDATVTKVKVDRS